MSTQYRDGTWSDTEPVDDALETLKDAISDGSAKQFVVGTQEEILAAQDESKTQSDIDELKRRMDLIDARGGAGDIVVPSWKDLDALNINNPHMHD